MFVDLKCKQAQIGLAYWLPPSQVLIVSVLIAPDLFSPIDLQVGGFSALRVAPENPSISRPIGFCRSKQTQTKFKCFFNFYINEILK